MTASPTKRNTFTAEGVLLVRRRYREDDTLTYQALAREYDVSPLTIGLLVRGKTWADLPGAQPDNRNRGIRRGAAHPHAKLTTAQVREMVARYDSDDTLTYGKLAQQYNVSRRIVAHTFNNLTEWLTAGELAGRKSTRVRGARRGELHPGARLNDTAIRHMRTLRHRDKQKYTLAVLAGMFDSCPSMVSRVVRGLSRPDAGGPIEGNLFTGQTQTASV